MSDPFELAEEARLAKNRKSTDISVPVQFTIHNGDYTPEDTDTNESVGVKPPTQAQMGFPINPLTQLDAHLDALDEASQKEESYWKTVGRSNKEEEQTTRGMTYEELISPLSTEQIRKKKEAAKQKKPIRGPMYDVEARVFIMGGHDWGGSSTTDMHGNTITAVPYDDAEDREEYNKLLSEAVNGEVLLSNKTVEGIQGTGKFKIFVEVLREKKP